MEVANIPFIPCLHKFNAIKLQLNDIQENQFPVEHHTAQQKDVSSYVYINTQVGCNNDVDYMNKA